MPPGGGSGKAQPDQGAGETQAQKPQGDAMPGEPKRHKNEGGEADPQRGAAEGARRAGPQDKRTSNMTKPVTEGSGPPRKDEFISTFGKRLEN
jgi:hypothetical protein